MSELFSADEVRRRFDEHDYLADDGMCTAVFLTLRLGLPLLLEGEPGVGKTAAAQALAKALDAPLVRLQCYEGLTASEALYDWNHQRQLLAIRVAEAQHERIAEADLFSEEFLVERPILRCIRYDGPQGAGAAHRRDRPGRRRVRGAAARSARRGLGDGAGARHVHRRPAADRGAHLQPQPRPSRRAASALSLPLARLPRARPAWWRSCADVRPRPTSHSIESAAQFVGHVRGHDLDKPPGVAEAINWVAALAALGATELARDVAVPSLGALAKTPDDRDVVLATLESYAFG